MLKIHDVQIRNLKNKIKNLKKILNLYPQFSEKYIDVKYSENCFREMCAKALSELYKD
jgi:hypothetical protein